MDKVLVIIVTYNAHDWIHQCLNSIDMERYDAFVVDNASSDDTLQILQTEYPKAIVRAMDKNLGFGQANNIGLRYALDNGYDYVFLLNQDAWLLPDTIERLIVAQKQNPEYWIVSPLHMSSENQGLERYFEYLCKLYSVNLCSNGIERVDFINAALWLVSRKCIESVGGFDPIFPHYGEDNDYVRRVRYWGGKLGIDISIIAYHEHPWKNKVYLKEQEFYRKKLVFLGLWKDINKSNFCGMLSSSSMIFRKVIRCLFENDYEEMKIYWNIWTTLYQYKKQIKIHRELSKQIKAFL